MLKNTFMYGGIVIMTLVGLVGCGTEQEVPAAATRPAPPTLGANNLAANTAVPRATAVTPTSAPVASNQPTDPAPEVIRRAILAQLNVPKERIVVKSIGADGEVTEMALDYVAPANFHVRTDEMELISIEGQGAWRKGENGWETTDPALANAFAAARDPNKIQELMEMIVWSDAKFQGAELLGGKPVWVYTYSTLFKGMKPDGGDLAATNKIWIGAVDGLPYKLVSVSESMLTPGTQDTTEQTHDYDTAITIAPPQ